MTRLFVLCAAALATGCAAIIGASFDDAGLATDASGPDAHDASPLFDVGEPEEAAPPFDPLSLSNLGFWIDATRKVDLAGDGSASRVARWHDLSIYGRDAIPAGGGSVPPTLVPAAMNGLPVVHFTAAELDLLVSSWVGPGTPETTMFLVTRGYPNSALRFQTSAGTYPFILYPYDMNQNEAAPDFYLEVGPTSPNYTVIHTVFADLADAGGSLASAVWRKDGTAATFANGVLVEQRITGFSLPSAQLYIGGVLPLLASPYTTLPFTDGDIAEAIVYTRALGDAERTQVESYLRAKWLTP